MNSIILPSCFLLLTFISTKCQGFMLQHPHSQSIISANKFTTTTTTTTTLFGYIAADSVDEEYDAKQGGVGLAQDNAILMKGKVDRKGIATATDLKHYTDVSTVDGDEKDFGNISVICKGSGVELYQDPGQGTEKNIILAPLDAVADALNNASARATSGDDAATTKNSKKICINFTGGEDLMVHEVLEGVQSLVQELDLSMGSTTTTSSSSSIEFRSLCHDSFPVDKCSVVVFTLAGGSGSSEELNENMYWHEGKWWTLLESNLNPAIE